MARPCIAIVTLQGAATFAIHATRRIDDVITQWTTHAGEVILLRGWQPHDHTDPRPWHRVDPPIGGSRLMFQARHNLAASTPPSALLSTLTDTEVDPLGAGGFLIAVAGEADPVKRRSLLAGLGLGAGVLTRSTVSEVLRQALMASLGATVDDWYEISESHGHDYMTVSAANLQHRLATDIACLGPTLAANPQLWAVACRLAALEAMILTSLGDKSQGDRWWRTARLAATRSGDVSVMLWLRGREAFRAAHEEVDPLAVLRMAEGVDAAEAHAARAWAYARLSDRRAATSAIEAAHVALKRLPQSTRPTMYQMAPWRLCLAESRVFALLGDRVAMWSALGEVPPDMVEWVAHREICIALAESTTGDRPSGLARANAALDKLPEALRVSVVRNLVREVDLVGRLS